jgi:hypothetical protein
MAHHTKMPTGHRSTITSSPLLLFLKLSHWTRHHTTLSTLMDLLPHTHTSVTTLDTETPTGHSITIMSSLLLPYPSTHHARFIIINTDVLVTTYTHRYRDTGPTPSQRQALECNTDPLSLIPRHRPPHFGYIGRLLSQRTNDYFKV